MDPPHCHFILCEQNFPERKGLECLLSRIFSELWVHLRLGWTTMVDPEAALESEGLFGDPQQPSGQLTSPWPSMNTAGVRGPNQDNAQ